MINMRNILFYSAIVATLLLSSCMQDNGNYNNNNNYNSGSNLTFWMQANCSTNPITVTIDGQSAQITQYFATSQPSCPSYGCANFYLPGGKTYTYTATGSDSTWTGSVTVPRSGCIQQLLTCATGTATFWVDSAANNIKVTIGTGSSHITAAFPTTTPVCGTTGCASFTLPAGTYSYTAITAANIGYSGSVTVKGDSCSLIRLY